MTSPEIEIVEDFGDALILLQRYEDAPELHLFHTSEGTAADWADQWLDPLTGRVETIVLHKAFGNDMIGVQVPEGSWCCVYNAYGYDPLNPIYKFNQWINASLLVQPFVSVVVIGASRYVP